MILRTATPVATWTLSSWSDFWSNLHGISTVFVVSVFVILCLVFLLTPLFWFWCDSSSYAIIYVYLPVCHCVRVSALSAHLQVDQNTEIFSRAPGKHTTHQTTATKLKCCVVPGYRTVAVYSMRNDLFVLWLFKTTEPYHKLELLRIWFLEYLHHDCSVLKDNCGHKLLQSPRIGMGLKYLKTPSNARWRCL